ncbi:hypothetical protein DH2020_011373 [Rehmannia glutinosa]|uniref:BHLH domain-containing protein n=1 Tax=Rehmannia glutinosa TaxID=99300 RepID=A0ABR0XD58_REHGL
MADDQFQLGNGSWWDTSRNRTFESGTTTPASINTTLASFGWPAEMVDAKSSSGAAASGGDGILTNQMMELGLSSQGMDWNQALFRGEKAESSFRSMLQEDHLSSNSSNFQNDSRAETSSQEPWRQKLFSGACSPEDASMNHDYKRRFSLDSNDSTITSRSLSSNFHVNSASGAYGLLLSENQPSYENQPMNYPYPYGANASELINPSWNKFPTTSFVRQSPPPPKQAPLSGSSHLQFTNSTPFWNAISAPAPAAMADARSSFFPGLQNQISSAPCFDDKKPKNTSEMRDLSTTTKKNNTETSNKRPRNETPTPLPAFKVRKEKMGDRITALQQLVSPFGKTDTASVLSEAIEYIKFLHEQVNALSSPYMKNGAPIQHQQINCDKSKDPEGPRQDLRSRGLCLVPVSSTFPMTHETTVDFWTPTFGGTFR